MIDKKMVKGLAIMSLVMLQANIFVPTGISLAEEGESVASTVQGESLAIESSSLQEDLASPAAFAEESVTGTAAQVFEEVVQATGEVVDASGVVMPSLDMLMSATGDELSGELSAGIISSLGMNVGGSTLVKYFTIGSDDEIPLLVKDDGTVDYEATKANSGDVTTYFLSEVSKVVDFGGEKVIFNKLGYPLFEKKDSIYRQALKVLKTGVPSLAYDLDASLKGDWTSLDSFVKYAEVKNSAAKIIGYFLLKANFDVVYAPVAGEAKIGNHGFLTLQDAIASANDGDTIVLTKDISAGKALYTTAVGAHVCTTGSSEQKTTGPKKVTIDFQGHTYNVADAVGSCSTESQAAHFEKGSEITLKNGTLTSNNANVYMIIQNY
ncbi:MAG: hypothetical protein ACFN4U_03135, partial [Candidatus Absconditicoccaceae bacterium]